MSTAKSTIEEAKSRIGEELGLSDWVTIDQAKLDAHARNTGDEDWLHNDPARAARESPFGKTIAQGSLLLSILVGFVNQIAPLADDIAYGLNYGFDRVRFIRPVPVDSRVRARMVLKNVRPKGQRRYVVTVEATLEEKGADEPRLAAEWLAMVVQA